MKKNDLLLMGGVAIVAALFAFVVSGKVFGSPSKHPISVPVVQKISPTFPNVQTDKDYQAIYNSEANDPTQLIQIGSTDHPQPFNK